MEVITEERLILLSSGTKIIYHGDIYISDGFSWVYYSGYSADVEVDLLVKPFVKLKDWIRIKNVGKGLDTRKALVVDIHPDYIIAQIDKETVKLLPYMYEPTLPKTRKNETAKMVDKESGGTYYQIKKQETGIENCKRFTDRQRSRFDKLRSDFRAKRRNR